MLKTLGSDSQAEHVHWNTHNSKDAKTLRLLLGIFYLVD